MDTLFKSSAGFSSLSLKDLVQARDLFHYHLINKKNVVATALGLYRIRKSDPWPDSGAAAPVNRADKSRRTLANSEVRPYSWPCVYVFVSSWEAEGSLSETDPSDVVPKTLYLPDGRAAPTCVIEARIQPWSKDLKANVGTSAPRNLLAPGTAIINEDGQGMARLGTAGCIVSDGNRYYVLTNRHVVGMPGTPIKALQAHDSPAIGVSAVPGLTRENASDIYPGLEVNNQRLLMDVGLVQVDDILRWKTEVPGIEPIGDIVDLYDNSLNLKLITMKVVGRSAVSGKIRGEIHGLLYRYKSLGGFEYISDFLIGPETTAAGEVATGETPSASGGDDVDTSFTVHHGDSGTLLFVEHLAVRNGAEAAPAATTYHPLALLWGREEFFDGSEVGSRPYALATALSTALDRLNLDYVRNINRDESFVWGWVGHYAIGRTLPMASDIFTAPLLKELVETNIDLLSIEPAAELTNDPRAEDKDGGAVFVPLADVPDNVWKSNVNFHMEQQDDGTKRRMPGPGSRGQADNPNHFADLDLEYIGGKTFLQLNQEDPDTYLNREAWLAYFAEMKPKFDLWDASVGKSRRGGSNHWGALPFRVHQLFDIMANAAEKGDATMFLCAGGVLIHYMGDACQPLHASYMSNGDPDCLVDAPRSGKKKLEADGVHSGYEDDMIAYGYQHEDLARKLVAEAGKATIHVPIVRSGYDASKAVIDLIVATQAAVPPRDIVDKWVELKGTPRSERNKAMWDAFGKETITCMARGTRYLACLWQSAWDVGKGDTTIHSIPSITKKALMTIYNDKKKLPSIALSKYPENAQSDWSDIG